jgi:hypothetical protein
MAETASSLERSQKPINLLVVPHKIHLLDPKRRAFGEMAGDLHDRKVLVVDPDLSFEEIDLLALRNSVDY